MSRITRTAVPLPVTRTRITRMRSRSIQAFHIMWGRLRPSTSGSSEIVIAIVVAMDSVVVVTDSGAMASAVIATDRKAESVGASKTTGPETPAAEEIAMKRFRRSSHRNSAVAISGAN
jgi:hypothetical protein